MSPQRAGLINTQYEIFIAVSFSPRRTALAHQRHALPVIARVLAASTLHYSPITWHLFLQAEHVAQTEQ